MKQIDVLPDDVLIEIFYFYVNIRAYNLYNGERGEWIPLVHVCRRWRNLVFGSPRRLHLQLCCTPKTPVRDTLDIWPALPLIVRGDFSSSTDNVIAALGQSDRVCKIDLGGYEDGILEEVLAVMQVPFPELTDLELWSLAETPPVIPDSFLAGSAPRLQYFTLSGIPFPGLPKLLLSANHLVDLRFPNIPHSGYISPEAMVALLSVLTSLESLELRFRSSQSRPDRESPSLPPPKRSILPALHGFDFEGVTEYLEDLVTRIDAPQLGYMHIKFSNSIDFDCPRLAQFINRTPILRAHNQAHVKFNDRRTKVVLLGRSCSPEINISWVSRREFEPDWQLSSVAQVCNSSLPTPSPVEDLYIAHEYSQSLWENDAIENIPWLQFLLPFTAVKNLYPSEELAPGIAAALQELVGARITEVLPSLQTIFLIEFELLSPFHEKMEQFVTARRLSGHPVTLYVGDEPDLNDGEEEEEEESALSCMHSTFASIGREADILLCAQRRI
jgi:hypothetical protein